MRVALTHDRTANLSKRHQEYSVFRTVGFEHFGITSLKAMAAGSPVIAYRGRGALETVLEGRTDTFFDSQDEQCHPLFGEIRERHMVGLVKGGYGRDS